MLVDSPDTGIPEPQRPRWLRRIVSTLVVLTTGTLSAAITLLAVFALERYGGINVLGWHFYCILPVGSVLVGVVASVGYMAAGWLTGLRIGGVLLFTIVALQLTTYGAIRYAEFKSLHLVNRTTHVPVEYFEYLDARSNSSTLTTAEGHEIKLGGAGQPIEILELTGFALGGAIFLGFLSVIPYCATCQTYMKTRRIALFPASLPYRPKQADAEAKAQFAAEQKAAKSDALKAVEMLMAFAAEGNGSAISAAVCAVEPDKKEISRLHRRVELELIMCGHCKTGTLRANLLSGVGSYQSRHRLAETAVTADVIAALI